MVILVLTLIAAILGIAALIWLLAAIVRASAIEAPPRHPSYCLCDQCEQRRDEFDKKFWKSE